MYYRFYVTLKTGRVITYDIPQTDLDAELDFLNQNNDTVLTYYYEGV